MCTLQSIRFGYLIAASLLSTVFFNQKSIAQDKPEILTNQKVVAMFKAGLDRSVIVNAIRESEGKFDVSSTGLVALGTQKVPTEIIVAMQEKQAGLKPERAAENAPVTSGGKRAPHPNIDVINQIYMTKTNDKMEALEKGLVNQAIKSSAFGSKAQYELEGLKAACRKADAGDLEFLVNTGGPAPEFVLYKTTPQKGKRIAVTLDAKMTGAKTGNNTIPVTVTAMGNGIYKLKPSVKLAKAEYFLLASRSAAPIRSMSTLLELMNERLHPFREFVIPCMPVFLLT